MYNANTITIIQLIQWISSVLLDAILAIAYTTNPHAIPNEMEYVNIIIIMVMNTEAATTKLSQFTSFNCIIIRIPTITNAGAVTDDVNMDKTSGANNNEIIKHIPVTIAVKPVLPPSPIPVALSTYAVIGLVPNTEPIIPPIASPKNAFSIPLALPSSSTNPHWLANGINVPVVSKNVTNNIENSIIIRLGILLNNSLNPDKKPPNTLISKLNDITCDVKAGIVGSPAPNPNAVNIIPMIAVDINPKNTAAGTFLIYSIIVIKIPITVKSADGDEIVPIPMIVAGLATITPEPLKPIKAKKNPIPAPIPNFKSIGIAFSIASRTPDMVISAKSILEINTADKAACHELPMVKIIV